MKKQKNKLQNMATRAAMSVLLCVGALSLHGIHAATITVTSTGDSGAGSLRDALAIAQDGDIIDATGISGTITLTNGELLVSNSVGIIGPGPGQLAVDGNAASRVFHVTNGVDVLMTGLTVTNGSAVTVPFYDGGGGGIHNDHSTLTVSNCVVIGNATTTTFSGSPDYYAAQGGGIFNDGSYTGGNATLTVPTLTVIASDVIGNSAAQGGGIENLSGVLILRNSIVTDNRAGLRGGGVCAEYATLDGHASVSNCMFMNNYCPEGGAINNEMIMEINACTLSENSAHKGGAIFNGSKLEMNVCTLSANAADEGGGIDFDYGRATISACTLSGNFADEGGGIRCHFGSNTVIACTLNGNQAKRGGAAFNEEGRLNLFISTITDNSSDDKGGGVFNFSNGDDGGIMIDETAALRVSACTLSGNAATAGKSIYNQSTNYGPATVEIGNTILKPASSGANLANAGAYAMVTSAGYNLSSDTAGGFLTHTGDQINKDPKLGPLADNGGPTLTLMPLAGSPAIDKGLSDAMLSWIPTTDQRGFPRGIDDPGIANATLGDGSDIGAVETGFTNHAPITLCQNVSVLAAPDGTASASINNGSYDPDNGDTIALSQTPPGPYPIGTTAVTLTATDSFGASSSCTAVVTVLGVADLLIGMGADKTSVKQGDTLTYTITVRNFGPNDASAVVVNDTLSTGATFVSAHANTGHLIAPPVGQTGVVTWSLGDLANAGQQAAQIKVTVTIKGKTTVTNTATTSSGSFDPNQANNTASLTTSVTAGQSAGKR